MLGGLETGDRRLDAGMLDAKCKILDTGYLILDEADWTSNFYGNTDYRLLTTDYRLPDYRLLDVEVLVQS